MDILQASPDCMIVSTRTFDAGIEDMFRAWTDPAHLQNWWGPKGFTNTFMEFDPRPGGRWRFVMHGPVKGDYHNECEFEKVEKPNLVAWKRLSKPLFRVVATFEVAGTNKTTVVFRMIFDSAEECNKLLAFVPAKNEENFDRLEDELARMFQNKTLPRGK